MAGSRQEVRGLTKGHDKFDGDLGFARSVALWSSVALLGAVAFLCSLVAYMPARVVVQYTDIPASQAQLSGTVWDGQMVLEDGQLVSWVLDTSASLFGFGAVFDWRLTDFDSNLDGRLAFRPRRLVIGPVSGNLSWGTVASFMPGLAVECNIMAVLNAIVIDIGSNSHSGSGSLTTSAGNCMRLGNAGASTGAPAMVAELSQVEDALRAVLTTQADRQTPLVTARLTPADRIVLTIHREGAALVPGLPTSTDSELDLPLAVLLQ